MRLLALVEGRFLRRLNRFAALVEVEGSVAEVHVANSGRMRELLQPGNPCLLAPVDRPGRKTRFDLALVAIEVPSDAGPPSHAPTGPSPPRSTEKGAGCVLQEKDPGLTLVSADARLPTALVWEAFREGWLAPFADYTEANREVVVEDGRLDLVLDGPWGCCFVEVKSVTLVEGGVGIFPDAPTERGRRHVGALAREVTRGHRAAVVFVVQRGDATAVVPNDATDPDFGAALRGAVAQGVEAYAYTCRVTREEVRVLDQIPVHL